MKIFAGGREIEVPTDTRGNVNIVDVRRAANIPDDRMLVQQRSGGENNILGLSRPDPHYKFVAYIAAKTRRARRSFMLTINHLMRNFVVRYSKSEVKSSYIFSSTYKLRYCFNTVIVI